MTEAASTECRHCGAPLAGPYCAQCGQRRAEPLALTRVLNDAWRKLGELDLRAWRTVRAMTTRPGWMIGEYIAGNRTEWANPAKYLFSAATVYAVVVGLCVDPELIGMRMFGATVSAQSVMVGIGALAYLGFVFLLVVAAMLRAVYRQRFASIGEAYVAMLFTYGHVFVLLTVPALFGAWNRAGAVAAMAVWVAFALHGLVAEPWWQRLGKTLLIVITYLVASFATVMLFSIGYRMVAA